MAERKRPILNKLKGFFSNPVVRGTLKTLPFGNLVYEWAENIKHARDPLKKDMPLPHSPISLLAQTVFLSLIVYAFCTGQLDVKELLQYVGIDDFKTFGSDPSFHFAKDTLK